MSLSSFDVISSDIIEFIPSPGDLAHLSKVKTVTMVRVTMSGVGSSMASLPVIALSSQNHATSCWFMASTLAFATHFRCVHSQTWTPINLRPPTVQPIPISAFAPVEPEESGLVCSMVVECPDGISSTHFPRILVFDELFPHWPCGCHGAQPPCMRLPGRKCPLED